MSSAGKSAPIAPLLPTHLPSPAFISENIPNDARAEVTGILLAARVPLPSERKPAVAHDATTAAPPVTRADFRADRFASVSVSSTMARHALVVLSWVGSSKPDRLAFSALERMLVANLWKIPCTPRMSTVSLMSWHDMPFRISRRP